MRCTWAIIGLLGGCASAPAKDPSEPDSGAAEVESDWVDPAADDDWSHLIDTVEAGPPVTAADIERDLNEALGLGLPTMGEVLSSYYALLAQGDATCPGSARPGGFEVFGTCTAESGLVFSGVSSIEETDERTFEGETWTAGEYWIRTSPADYTITRPDGTALEAGGFIQFRRELSGGVSNWDVDIEGSWRDSAADNWLGAGISSAVRMRGSGGAEYIDSLVVDGTYSLGSHSLGFDNLVVVPEECPDGIQQGTLTLRTGGGPLASVRFDDCSPCGALTLDDGTALGDVCIDPAPVVSSLEPSGWIP